MKKIALVASAVAMSLSACSSDDAVKPFALESERPEFAEQRALVSTLLERLDCERSAAYYDDLYFWDRAVGAECVYGDDQSTTIFVYVTAGSPRTALAHSETTVNRKYPALVSDHVLVTGRAADVKALRYVVDETTTLVTTQPFAPPVSKRNQELLECVNAAESTLANFAEGEPEPDGSMDGMEQFYPGYESITARMLATKEAKALVGLDERDFLNYESKRSAFGPAIKDFCAEVTVGRQ